MEAESGTARDWIAPPEYHAAVEAALGPGGAKRLVRDCAVRVAELNAVAGLVYGNWMRVALRV